MYLQQSCSKVAVKFQKKKTKVIGFMKLDFSFYIGILKKNLIEHAGQGNCGIFLLEPLSKIAFIDVSETKISRWVNNRCAIDEALRIMAGTDAGYNETLVHFKNNVIKDINKNMIDKIVFDIEKVIEDDFSIDKNKKESFKNLYLNGNVAEFMTSTFLYVVSIQTDDYVALPLNLKSSSETIDGKQFLIEKLMSNLENMEISSSLGLPDNEIALISSGNYNLKMAAKEDKHSFTVYAEVKADEISTEHATFVDYMNWLQFTGKGAEVELRRICVFDYLGRKLIEETDPIYMGRSLPVPPVKVKEYSSEMKNLVRSKIYVKPPQDTLELELTDLYGNCLFGLSKYRVEREKKGSLCTATFISDDNEDLIFRYIFIGGTDKNRSKLQFSIKIDRKDPTSSKCNAAYYNLIIRIYESSELKIWQKKEGKRREFIKIPGFKEKNSNELDSYRRLLEIYQKIIYIENAFNIEFNVSDFTPDNMSMTLKIHELLTKGRVNMSINEYSLTSDYYDSYKEKIVDLNGDGVLFNGYISDIDLFDKQIEVEGKYKMAIWASQVIVNEDKSFILKVIKSVLYDITNENIDESDILKLKK